MMHVLIIGQQEDQLAHFRDETGKRLIKNEDSALHALLGVIEKKQLYPYMKATTSECQLAHRWPGKVS